MTTINELAAVSEVFDGDQFLIWSAANNDSRRAPAGVVKSYMAGAGAASIETAFAAPSATGFTVTLAGTNDLWLVLTPTAAFAAGTIVLPPLPIDHQRVDVVCNQAVTALTLSGGDTAGAPAALAANGFFSMRYEGVIGIWRRIG